jgi:protein-tyrosine phosphatase
MLRNTASRVSCLPTSQQIHSLLSVASVARLRAQSTPYHSRPLRWRPGFNRLTNCTAIAGLVRPDDYFSHILVQLDLFLHGSRRFCWPFSCIAAPLSFPVTPPSAVASHSVLPTSGGRRSDAEAPLITTLTESHRRPALAMDRLRSGFHRKSRKASPSRPTIITDGTHSSGKTTPEPVSAHSPLQVPNLPNKDKKTSPFRSLRDFSRSHKRARSPATGSLPRSPIGATYTFDGLDDTPASSPTVRGGGGDSHSRLQDMNGGSARGPPPKMPSFLALPPQDVVAKFQEIVWMERNRIMQSLTNTSPDFKWARVTGDHLKKLDRYMNIQPWENNRVRLRVPSGKVDYVNASPITLSSTTPQSASRSRAQGQVDQDSTILGLSDLAGGEPDRYIAMQGPKRNTTDHVWRMVVEQLESPAVIVMLTETHEANMEKCYPYFPRSPNDAPLEINERDEFGDAFRASVHCEAIEETEAGDAIELRKLIIRSYKSPHRVSKPRSDGDRENLTTPVNAVDASGDIKMLSPLKSAPDNHDISVEDGSGDRSATADLGVSTTTPQQDLPGEYEERVVWHFLYKKWPDFGVPAFEDLDSFFTLMRLSRDKNASPENPRIVHCSAGVGRSGTFIALEHLMRELDAGVLENWDSPSHFRHGRTDEGGSATTEGENHNGNRRGEDDPDGKMDVADPPAAATGAEGDDLIFHTVNQLREQRRSMVQAEPQFLFIYEVMRKLWEERYGTGVSPSTSAVAAGKQTPPPRISGPGDVGGDESDTGQPARKRQEFDPFVEQQRGHQA